MNSFTPTEFLNVVNQTLEYAYSSVTIVGEVASFKVNQGKWVFFDLKDEESSVGCFMPLWSLRVPLEDGMKVMVKGAPKITKWGKFSFTVAAVAPVGEGSLKKAYELLKKKLEKEGLFAEERKRPIPADLTRLGVISSTQAAGYADFIKIINARWGGMKVQVAHTQVQGLEAPDQIIRAIKYFNERAEVDVIAILRGGGSADDLAAFNDEELVRTIAASKIPIITGIGHEVDESLADLVADVRASTPSNAAEMLTRDRVEETTKLRQAMRRLKQAAVQEIEKAEGLNAGKVERISHGLLVKYIEPMLLANREKMQRCLEKIRSEYKYVSEDLARKRQLIDVLNPEKVLKQGYVILAGEISLGNVVKITTYSKEIEAEVKNIKERIRDE
ncbi:MAG: exodeoxyribonuclease VII large subunit [Candidatus Saccharibacteria bacterium]|nr:exodeoxyribonuclease VII large subunit [Candidatus Saccharibacteria bacterium]